MPACLVTATQASTAFLAGFSWVLTRSRARLVVAASVPVRSVHGADGLVESTREGDVIVLDVPVGRGGGTVVVPVG